jgi:hypothetical protein
LLLHRQPLISLLYHIFLTFVAPRLLRVLISPSLPHFRFFNFFLDKKLLPAYSHPWVISRLERQHPLLAFSVLVLVLAVNSFRIRTYGQTPRFAGF